MEQNQNICFWSFPDGQNVRCVWDFAAAKWRNNPEEGRCRTEKGYLGVGLNQVSLKMIAKMEN